MKYHSTFLVAVTLACLLLSCTVPAQAKVTGESEKARKPTPNTSSRIRAKLGSFHDQVTHLLEHIGIHDHHDEASRQLIKEYRAKIHDDVDLLVREEGKLFALRAEKDAVRRRGGLLWYFDTKTRNQVEEIQLKINAVTRTIHGIRDDIQHAYKKVKPAFGVLSKVFLYDVLSFFPFLSGTILELVESLISFGLLAFIFGGPLMFWLIHIVISAFGSWTFLFIIPGFFTSLYWVFHIPFIIMEYDPTLAEFALVYVPVTLIFGKILSYFTQSLFDSKEKRD
eukprot:TRINITY_DN459_c0_g1_i2.p1 TRINITY_DN459_c0_g1~~TRINITY_DN459_c0_g1_i2.p1  ORF type:complete len:281 (-),score=65.18 TRINITY_DN459_c0_g1_i2:108-950(-)